MICSKCKKRPAVVFLANGVSDNKPEGLCIICAKEAGIKPIASLIDKMGISDEDLEEMHEQFDELMDMDMFQQNKDEFTPGGAATFPFLQNLFQGDSQNDEEVDKKFKSTGKKSEKKAKKKILDNYCVNLTEKALNGKLDRIIGRDREINRTIQILSRRTKNNPCLIGEPGVGKTAIAEALAIRIAEGNVPIRLKGKQLYLLDLTSLVAGTQFRGQFEGRIKSLIEEIKEFGNVILFIDEVHNLVGTGDSEGSMNAANILKPALSRGEIQVIGATTFSEYRKYIEKDSALERRFQPVTIGEPTIKETIELLNGIKDYYEMFHRVSIPENIIKKIVVLSERYINDRFLPDKAIDLLDESCTHASLRNKNLQEYDETMENIRKIKSEQENISSKDEEIDYEKLAELRCELARLDKKAKEIEPLAINSQVCEDDISHVIELWTGIPSSKICTDQLKKLIDIEDKLKLKIVGQDEAVKVLSDAIRCSRIMGNSRKRPVSFIFVGPTGVGKTELANVLANELFDTPETIIRLDMSEFMEKHSVSKIIGAPPGYVGYDESGQLTEKVRRKPYSVILFDEIEKAHPDVMNILLQVLDNGKITDSQGRVVNFENTVIIMTSNAGSDKKSASLGFEKDENDVNKEKAMKSLSEFLRPEFLSRIDEIIVFQKLTLNNFKEIARIMLNEYVDSLSEEGIKLSFEERIIDYIAEKSFGQKSGARDIRHLIRREIENQIALKLIKSDLSSVKKIDIKYNNGIQIEIC